MCPLAASVCLQFSNLRTIAAHSRGRRKYIPVGLMTAVNTSFTSYASPDLRESYLVTWRLGAKWQALCACC
jgi:hypothetical protein